MIEPDFIKPIGRGYSVKVKSENKKYNYCYRNNHELIILNGDMNKVYFICKDCENSGELG